MKRLYIALYKEIGWFGSTIRSDEKRPRVEANDPVKKKLVPIKYQGGNIMDIDDLIFAETEVIVSDK